MHDCIGTREFMLYARRDAIRIINYRAAPKELRAPASFCKNFIRTFYPYMLRN